MDTLKAQITALPTDEWELLLGWVVGEEKSRRDAAPLVEQGRVEVVEQIVSDHPELAPETGTVESWTETGTGAPAWVDPGTSHPAMYRQGDVVAHNGRVWVSRHPFLNHWEPGSVGVDGRIWEDITDSYQPPAPEPDPEPPATPDPETPTDPETPAVPEFVQPTGAHDAYSTGDRITWIDGTVWESVIDGNVWSPIAYEQGWKKVT